MNRDRRFDTIIARSGSSSSSSSGTSAAVRVYVIHVLCSVLGLRIQHYGKTRKMNPSLRRISDEIGVIVKLVHRARTPRLRT